jgi:hypothetical protein
MIERLAIVQGHPTPRNAACCTRWPIVKLKVAVAGRYDVRRIELAKLQFPLLCTRADFETGARPPRVREHAE